MRVLVVPGLLWKGSPALVLEAAEAGVLRLFSSASLLEELEGGTPEGEVLEEAIEAGVDPGIMVQGFREGIVLVVPVSLGPVVTEDPDDDAVLACAIAARAEAIVSGDPHLLDVRSYQGIPILTPAELLERIGWV